MKIEAGSYYKTMCDQVSVIRIIDVFDESWGVDGVYVRGPRTGQSGRWELDGDHFCGNTKGGLHKITVKVKIEDHPEYLL